MATEQLASFARQMTQAKPNDHVSTLQRARCKADASFRKGKFRCHVISDENNITVLYVAICHVKCEQFDLEINIC